MYTLDALIKEATASKDAETDYIIVEALAKLDSTIEHIQDLIVAARASGTASNDYDIVQALARLA